MQEEDQINIGAEPYRNDYINTSGLFLCCGELYLNPVLRILARWRIRRNRCSEASPPGRVAQDLHKQQMVSLAGER